MKLVISSFISLASICGACEMSLRDQALLVAKSATWPFPGHTSRREIVGSKVGCVSFGRVTVLHFPGESFLALLDTARVFARWEYTLDRPSARLDYLFQEHVENLNKADSEELLRVYGIRDRYPDDVIRQVVSKIRSGFEQVTLLSREEYLRAGRTVVGQEHLRDMRTLLLSKVISSWLAKEEGEPFDQLLIEAPLIKWLSTEITVVIKYRRLHRGDTIRRYLLIPVNVEAAPFVGVPYELLDLSKAEK